MAWPFDPQIAPVAAGQLAAWEKIAEDWPLAVDEEGVARCKACGQGVILWLDEHHRPYRYTRDEVMALTVLHLRNHHPELDPDPS